MKAQSQRRLRQLHRWLGLFFAPAILFFALTGTLQSLGFQDRSGSYEPPAWISVAANVHKHGAVSRPERRPPAPTPARPAEHEGPASGKRPGLGAFSIFSALLGLLLAAATALGIWIGLLNRRDRRGTLLLLAAGLALPALLLLA